MQRVVVCSGLLVFAISAFLVSFASGQAPSAPPQPAVAGQGGRPFEYVEANVPFYPAGKAWGTIAGGKLKMQLPVPPNESMRHMVTPAGFRVELFASEPMLEGKPLAMNWDERGRLWICESLDYPNELQPAGQGRDRIRIFEDTNGDGRADMSTVFAEGLSIPTAITFYRGGALVQDGRETVYLKDLNGDGKADLRKVLITGWVLGDTHGGVSNFQYGLDNWYYGMQGYNTSRPVYDDGRQRSLGFRMGFFRFQVAGEGEQTVVKEVEFLRSTNNNTWGLGISEEGLIFGSTANNNPSEFMPIPNRYYEAVRGWSSGVLGGIADSNRIDPLDASKVRQVDQHGGFTAAAGHALYTARNYPREYWNRTAFVAEPTGHLIATFVIRPDGAGFRSRNSWNLLASDDEWTAPIMAEVGPDGNVWFIDWYNYIVQHNPTPAGFRTGRGNAYESEFRDKKHGRIYRLVWAGTEGTTAQATVAQAKRTLDLKEASPDELVSTLRSDNFFWRRQAQRLLVEGQHRAVQDQIVELAKSDAVDAIGLNTSVIHALWTLHGLNLLEGKSKSALDAAQQAIRHRSPGVRRNAIAVLPHHPETVEHVAQLAIKDPDAQVRLAALLAGTECPPSLEFANMVWSALETPANVADRWMRDGLIACAARHDFLFLSAGFFKQPEGRTFETPAREVIRRVAEHYARGNPADTVGEVLTSIARQPASHAATEIIVGLAAGWSPDKPVPLTEGLEGLLVQLAQRVDPPARSHLVSLGLRWGSKRLDAYVTEIAGSLLTQVQDSSIDDSARIAAAAQLIDFRPGDAKTAVAMMDLITPRMGPALAEGLVQAVGRSSAAESGKLLSQRLSGFTPQLRAVGLRVLMTRTEWTTALVDELAARRLQLIDLTLDQKSALTAHPNRNIARRVRELLIEGGGLPSADRQKVIEELMPLTMQTGDPVAGKAVFMKTCAKCHTHSGEGTRIGPDLTGMAVHPKHELLIQIADPSRSVEGNYRIYSVVTDAGLVINGLLASETRTAIELIDAEAKKHIFLRSNIEQLVASTKSLMPDGIEKQHSPREITDLLEFLTQRGKYLPISLEKYATVVSTKGMFNSEVAAAERLVFADWSPKQFEGVPFVLVDPQGDRIPNAVMLQGSNGTIPPRMPRSISIPCHSPARAIHFLSGVSGWGFPSEPRGSHTLTVRLHYDDGQSEDHELINGEHFADYIRRVDVPGSKFAFALREQQIRYLAILPKRTVPIGSIELVKGRDSTAPVVMAITLESP